MSNKDFTAQIHLTLSHCHRVPQRQIHVFLGEMMRFGTTDGFSSCSFLRLKIFILEYLIHTEIYVVSM